MNDVKPKRALIHEDLTRSLIGAFFDTYFELGFGFLEGVYGEALDVELQRRGHHVQREVWVTVYYKGTPLRMQRMDRIVDDKVVLELKSTVALPAGAKRQLLNYLRVSRYEVGLLLHFGLEPEFHRLAYANPTG